MNLASIGKLVTRSGLFAALLAMPALGAVDFSATATVSPVSHTGACPFEFKFTGTIKYTGNSKHQEVQYKWIRSDGADAPTQTIFFDGPGTKNVMPTSWTLSAQGHNWEAVSINYPTSPAVNSNHAEFDLKCQVVQIPRPVPLVEDCINFDPKTIKAALVQGNWKVVEGPGGSHWMFDFGAKKDAAELAARIIQHYGANKSCFVDRPNPHFSYLLVGAASPAGSAAGEDCLGFNPATFKVEKVGTSWKVVDGSQWMFDFGADEAGAIKTFNIIKKYGFNQSCFVGRPNPGLQYMRK